MPTFLETLTDASKPVGTVFLVGAGPGDPGLLTLKGRDCLAKADLVFYDGLVNPLLLRLTNGRCERTARSLDQSLKGSSPVPEPRSPVPESSRVPQAEVNARMIAAARQGLTVVRLKGGDPFIFGRGGEEAAALKAAGIPYEVVPGVTAAVAVSAYAGISLTHREHASAVAFITGHEDPAKGISALNFASLAAFPGTLVFYMGLHRLAHLATSLIKEGRAAETPVAVISRGTTSLQRTITGPLHQIAEMVDRAELHPPSLLVIGECVRQRESLEWFETRRLLGQRIAITRPELCLPTRGATPTRGLDEAIQRCLDLGAEPILLPTMRLLPPDDWSPVDHMIERLSEFDYLIFTSVHGVDSFCNRIWETGKDLRVLSHVRFATIGPATAGALEAWHLRPEITPNSYRAEALSAALRPHVSGKRLLWVRANRGRNILPTELRAAGAQFEEVVVYRHEEITELPPGLAARIEQEELEWIALSSPAIARGLKQLLPETCLKKLGHSTRLAAISPVTAEAAVACGLPIQVTAQTHTWPGLFDAILECR